MGKGRVVSKLTLQKRRSAVSSFVAWAAAFAFAHEILVGKQ